MPAGGPHYAAPLPGGQQATPTDTHVTQHGQQATMRDHVSGDHASLGQQATRLACYNDNILTGSTGDPHPGPADHEAPNRDAVEPQVPAFLVDIGYPPLPDHVPSHMAYAHPPDDFDILAPSDPTTQQSLGNWPFPSRFIQNDQANIYEAVRLAPLTISAPASPSQKDLSCMNGRQGRPATLMMTGS